MPGSYAIPFGPTFNPLYEADGAFFFDDFIGTSISATDDAGVWDDVSTTGTSVVSAAEPWGAVLLTSGDAANAEDAGLELNGEPFRFDHTKDMMFAARFKVGGLTASVFLGLHEEGFDVQSGSVVNAHIGFSTQSNASIDFSSSDGTSQTIEDTTDDLVADTYVRVMWKYSAANKRVTYYVDGVKRGSADVGTEFLPTDAKQLTLGIHIESSGTSTTLTVDYVMVAGER